MIEVGEGDRRIPSVRHPITLSDTPADYRRPPPMLDEHGDDLRRWLGTDSEELPT